MNINIKDEIVDTLFRLQQEGLTQRQMVRAVNDQYGPDTISFDMVRRFFRWYGVVKSYWGWDLEKAEEVLCRYRGRKP